MEIPKDLVYKIVDRNAWEAARASGEFPGAAVDLEDGYIHFSTAAQVAETGRLHFSGQTNLLLVAVDVAEIEEGLRWEASRGGQLFPHLYGPLPFSAVIWERPYQPGESVNE